MTEKLLFRRARPVEAETLGNMTIAGLSYWGHDKNFPDLMEDLRQNDLPTQEYIEAAPVFVAEEDEKVVGYYGLDNHEDFVDLRFLFLDIDYIGMGYGKVLWLHAVEEAKKSSFDRLRILSDPESIGFYRAMGAKQEGELTPRPDFVIGIFWFDLNSD